MSHPRILLITSRNIFEDNSSSSLTIKSFLQKWPREFIFQVVCADFNVSTKCDFDSNLLVFGHDSIILARKLVNRKRVPKSHTKLSIEQQTNKYSITTLLKSTIHGLYEFLPYSFSNKFFKKLDEFEPQIIYSDFTCYRMMAVSNYLSRKYRIPILPHFMDDWPSIYLSSTLFLRPLYSLFNKRLHDIIVKAPAIFCISEYMCEEYIKRYSNTRAIPLMHSVNIPQQSVSIHGNRRFIYVGSLYLGRIDTIKMICDVLDRNYGTDDIELSIYCPYEQWRENEAVLSAYGFVNYGGFKKHDDLMLEISNSDYLVLAESFDASLLKYTGFSMSTKIPEYLSSKKPIIAVGHPKQPSIRYLKEHFAGYVADNPSELELLVVQINNDKIKDEIIKNAYNLFLLNHECDSQNQLFLNVVQKSMEK